MKRPPLHSVKNGNQTGMCIRDNKLNVLGFLSGPDSVVRTPLPLFPPAFPVNIRVLGGLWSSGGGKAGAGSHPRDSSACTFSAFHTIFGLLYPGHFRPFFAHFRQVGSARSQVMRRLLQAKHASCDSSAGGELVSPSSAAPVAAAVDSIRIPKRL